MGRVILDSSVLIAIYDEQDAHHSSVRRQFEDNWGQYEISALTITEVLTAPMARTPTSKELFLKAVKASIQVVHPVTEEIALLAGSMRVASGLKTPDAIISATASLAGTTLWTLDQKLAKAHKGAVLIS
jgi:predicted nucleic acid-binding protein